jgi:hypothetical protein
MTMANIYDVGDLVRVTGTWEDSDGTDTDPAGTITFKYNDPSDNTTSLVYGVDAEVVKSATGIYYTDISIDEHGTWWYRFESGTGTGQAAAESYFEVADSRFD